MSGYKDLHKPCPTEWVCKNGEEPFVHHQKCSTPRTNDGWFTLHMAG